MRATSPVFGLRSPFGMTTDELRTELRILNIEPGNKKQAELAKMLELARSGVQRNQSPLLNTFSPSPSQPPPPVPTRLDFGAIQKQQEKQRRQQLEQQQKQQQQQQQQQKQLQQLQQQQIKLLQQQNELLQRTEREKKRAQSPAPAQQVQHQSVEADSAAASSTIGAVAAIVAVVAIGFALQAFFLPSAASAAEVIYIPPPPFPCMLVDGSIHMRCFHDDKTTKLREYIHTFGGLLSSCPQGYGWDSTSSMCYKCPLNTQVTVDSKSALSTCRRCPDGTHNPDPAVYTQCACLPYLERRHDNTCQPCAIGFYKTFDMRHSEPCTQCPADKNVSNVGSRSVKDCYKPPSGWMQKYMRNALEIIKEQMQALVQKTANMLKALKEKLFKKWSKVTEYLKTKSTDTWQNVDKMFEQLDKETFGSTALNFTHATGKKRTCSFFWFFCRDLPKFERPDDPNVCPYKSREDFLEHIEEQPDWIDWRNTDVELRAAKARKIALRFHPDKWDQYNPICDHDHTGEWAVFISQRVVDFIEADKEEFRIKKK